MSGPVVKYGTAPTLSFSNPTCDACAEEVTHNGDGWECERCGTYWDNDAGESDAGTLYEDWAGEDNEGEHRTHADGYLPTQYEKDNPKPSIWDNFGTQLGKALRGKTHE